MRFSSFPIRPFLALPLLIVACAAEQSDSTESSTANIVQPPPPVHEWTDKADAPAYDGTGFAKAQIFRVSDGLWVDESVLEGAIGASEVTYFGEQHQTAPVQALERWVMAKHATKHADGALAMEHFQADEQPVIDKYWANEIDQATFEMKSQPWPGYATYWRALVEDAKANGRKFYALNVPKEVLGGLYGAFPTWPIDAYDDIPATSAYNAFIPARPIAPWDMTYQGWFETSFDYASHGQGLGLDYNDALHYFTDLAQIRDETMALFVTKALDTSPHLFVVCGDWHIQTRLAVPDRVARIKPATTSITITTAPAANVDDVRDVTHAGRAVADYIITYQ